MNIMREREGENVEGGRIEEFNELTRLPVPPTNVPTIKTY